MKLKNGSSTCPVATSSTAAPAAPPSDGDASTASNAGSGSTGAGPGAVGSAAAAKAAPDGYTLFMAIDSTLVMNQFLYKSLPYDPFGDFVPITLTVPTGTKMSPSPGARSLLMTVLTQRML